MGRHSDTKGWDRPGVGSLCAHEPGDQGDRGEIMKIRSGKLVHSELEAMAIESSWVFPLYMLNMVIFQFANELPEGISK